MLRGVHEGGKTLSTPSKGNEREAFINNFLSEVLPRPFRFGTGDATDQSGRMSGQLDVVVEVPLMPSIPLPGGHSRLYLAEGIAAVIEVKSNLTAQWSEVLKTSEKLAPLQRNYNTLLHYGPKPSEQIPLFAVGYTGWKNLESLEEKLACSNVTGILVIDSGLFATTGGMKATGPWSLWGLIASLTILTSGPHLAVPDPLIYATP